MTTQATCPYCKRDGPRMVHGCDGCFTRLGSGKIWPEESRLYLKRWA